MSNAHGSNPLDMLQGMWNQMGFQLPGMVTPTLDEGELDKQIRDLRSVENWLRMNLSMLQMTIQNLEMQKSALGTFRSMSEHFSQPTGGTAEATPAEESAPTAPLNAFFQAMRTTTEPSERTPDTEPHPAAPPTDEASLAKAAMWPWEMMSELNATMQAQLADTKRQRARPPAAKKAASKTPTKKTAAKRKPTAARK